MKPNDLSTDTLASLFDQSTDCVKLLDPEGRVVWMNHNGQNVMEIDDFCAVEGGLWAEFWPEDQRPLIEATMVEGAESSTHRFRAPCPTAKGTKRWWDVTVSPILDTNKEHSGFLAISRDISGEQAAQEALERSMSEMRHRLKNVFATTASLLRVNGRGTEAVEVFAKDMASRLDALSHVQTLFKDTSKEIRLSAMITMLLAPFQSEDCTVSIGSIPDVVMQGTSGDSVALVLGELCVHAEIEGAIRHGGSIEIAASHTGERLTLSWTETLENEVISPVWSDGRGLSLTQRIVETRGDALLIDERADGMTATLSVKLT